MFRRSLILAFFSAVLSVGAAAPAGAKAPPRAESFKLAPHRPGVVDAYILSFGLWGPQSVFESEAKGAAKVLANQLGSPDRTIVRFNTKRQFGARPQNLLAAAQAVSRTIDRNEDVAVLVLTSHGSPDGIGLVAGREAGLMRPKDVKRLLDETGARYRVLIVSACYSGIFAEALADPRTLVITAASSDRPSFGCRDGATWTYFGDAFFNRALRQERRLDQAFTVAKELVTRREMREKFDPSNPQIAGGEEVLERLGRQGAAAQSRY